MILPCEAWDLRLLIAGSFAAVVDACTPAVAPRAGFLRPWALVVPVGWPGWGVSRGRTASDSKCVQSVHGVVEIRLPGASCGRGGRGPGGRCGSAGRPATANRHSRSRWGSATRCLPVRGSAWVQARRIPPRVGRSRRTDIDAGRSSREGAVRSCRSRLARRHRLTRNGPRHRAPTSPSRGARTRLRREQASNGTRVWRWRFFPTQCRTRARCASVILLSNRHLARTSSSAPGIDHRSVSFADGVALGQCWRWFGLLGGLFAGALRPRHQGPCTAVPSIGRPSAHNAVRGAVTGLPAIRYGQAGLCGVNTMATVRCRQDGAWHRAFRHPAGFSICGGRVCPVGGGGRT